MPHHQSGSTAVASSAPANANAANLGASPSADSASSVGGGAAATTATAPTSTTTPAYSPPRIDGGAAAAIMRKTTHSQQQDPTHASVTSSSAAAPAAPAGGGTPPHTVVTPVVGAKPWVGFGGAVIHHPHSYQAAAAAAAHHHHAQAQAQAQAAAHYHYHHPHAPHFLRQQQHHHHHHVLPTGKSTDSTDAKSTTTNASQASGSSSAPTLMSASCDTSPSPPSAVTNNNKSMDERDGAANALLGLFTAAAGPSPSSSPSSDNNTSDKTDGPTRTSSPPIPFKKRLIMEKDAATAAAAAGQTSGGQPDVNEANKNPAATAAAAAASTSTSGACHISPVSHSSSRTESKDTPPRYSTSNTAADANNGATDATTANRSESYDSTGTGKDSIMGTAHQQHQNQRILALLAESKVHNASQIAVNAQQLTANKSAVVASSSSSKPAVSSPPRMVMHFPTVLHQVLAEPRNAALQWLPDGESFQITNWTSLRREVLPAYFGDLRDEHGTVSSAGTIDAFLYHLGAWGFEETKDSNGSSASGAYRHELFIRGAQKLCVRMRFTADQLDDGHKGPKTVSPTRPSTLQVPTLAPHDRNAAVGATSMLPNKRPRYEGTINTAVHWPYGHTTAEPWGGVHRHGAGLPPQHYNSPEHLYGMRAGVSAASAAAMAASQYGSLTPGASSYPSELQFRRYSMDSTGAVSQPASVASRQYSPPQVRSARGGMRLAANRATAKGTASPSSAPSPALSVIRQNFPVSNRGKGPRKPASVRNTAVPATQPAESTEGNKAAVANTVNRSESPKADSDKNATTLSEAQRIGQGVADAIARKSSAGFKRKLPMASKTSPKSLEQAVEEEKKED